MEITSYSVNQPFQHNGVQLVCNGEVYNYPQLKTLLESQYCFHSGSDCEVLIPLYERVGIDVMMKMLDAEFALVLVDSKTGKIYAGRDPMGIRPMFYGYDKQTDRIAFASEAKALVPFCLDIQPFPPGHYYADGEFICYNDLADPKMVVEQDIANIATHLRTKLEAAVVKRLSADAPLGFLLSGGLDSSLVCAIAQKHLDKPH